MEADQMLLWDPSGYSNVLTAYLDTMPYLKIFVYYGGALAGAVVLCSWMAPSRVYGTANQAEQKLSGRRRHPQCALAILPDGSKDRSDREWRELLPENRYLSLRRAQPDEANLSRAEGGLEEVLGADGQYVCAGCRTPLYDSDARIEMGCGWPCFYTCYKHAVRERRDADGLRMELLCNACGGHLGHIFRGEGWNLPPPAERHCLNSRSLLFVPDDPDNPEHGHQDDDADDDDAGEDDDLDVLDEVVEDAKAGDEDAKTGDAWHR